METIHNQYLESDANGEPVAVDELIFCNMLDNMNVRLLVKESSADGTARFTVSTQNLEVPDHSWTLQTEGILDLS